MEQSWLYVGLMASILIGVAYMVLENCLTRRNEDPIVSLLDEVRDLKETSTKTLDPEGDLVVRVDRLEIQFAELRKDCLRYLQKAAGIEAKLKRDQQDVEEESEEMTAEQAQALIDQQPTGNGAPGGGGRMSLQELEELAASGE